MDQNAMVVAAHPPYSPALAPPDFSRFAHVKGLLNGELFETGKQSVPEVEGILRSREKSTLTTIRLHRGAQTLTTTSWMVADKLVGSKVLCCTFKNFFLIHQYWRYMHKMIIQ
jgi:hypothetical protein